LQKDLFGHAFRTADAARPRKATRKIATTRAAKWRHEKRGARGFAACFARTIIRMGMNAKDLRATGDRDLFDKLRLDPDVRHRLTQFERDGQKQRARRHLLGSALRLSKHSAPEVHAIVDECAKKLDVTTELELYVYPDTRFNAACVRPEGGRLFVLFSSALFESFESDELRFVIGHELGHHLFDHHAIPAMLLLDGEEALSGPAALQVYAWSRFAEVSADRAGLVCAGSLDVATSTLFKLASGLRRASGVRVDVDELLSQVADMESEDRMAPRDEGRVDWFATHPFSPLRLKAVQLFAASELFTAKGTPRAPLEAETQQLMSIMDPSYLTDTSDAAKIMRRFLFAGGVLVADASGGISKEEVAVLEKFLGPGAVDRANPAAIRDALPRMVQSMLEDVPPLRRGQVIRDLCVVALADGRIDPDEERVLNELATAVGVDTSLIARTLAAAHPLD
jgi:hypothetical protein